MMIFLIIISYIICGFITFGLLYYVACLEYKKWDLRIHYDFQYYRTREDWDITLSLGSVFWPIGLIGALAWFVCNKIRNHIENKVLTDNLK